jgi:hypothetical protein
VPVLPYVRVRRLAPAAFALGVAAACGFLLLPVWAPQSTVPGAMLGAGLALLFTWQSDRLAIVVTRNSLSAGFRLFRSRIPLADLVRVERDRARLVDLRAAFRRGLALTYVVGDGPALFIRRRRGLPVLVSCDAPDEVFAALREAGASPAVLGEVPA